MAHVPHTERLSRARTKASSEADQRGAASDAAVDSQTEERALIQQAQAGEVAAYEELVRRHQQRVLAIVGGVLRRREDVEDVAQQVLIKVYVSLKRFDLRSSFSTWLYKVAVNECFDYLRKKKVRRLVYEADMSEEQVQQLDGVEREHPGTPKEDAGRRVELRELVDWLLGELPEEERLMLVLKEVEGLTVEEVGEVLSINVNTVKVRMFRARAKLVELYRRRTADRTALHRGLSARAGEGRRRT